MNAVTRRPAKRIVEGSTLERVKYWYEHGEEKIELTKVEEAQRKRWETAYHIIRKQRAPERAAQMLSRLFHVPIGTARRDVSNANKLFGGMIEANKEMDRALLSEWALDGLKWAKKEKDLSAYNKAIANLTKIKGLDRDEAHIPDFSNIETQNNLIIVADPNAVGLKPIPNLEKLISSFNKTKIAEAQAEEYE